MEKINEQLDKLRGLFGEVLFEDIHEEYFLLTCQNNAKNKSVIKKEVWLQIKIAKRCEKYYTHSLLAHIESIVFDILALKENLFEGKLKKSVQTSLFGDELEEGEPEPQRHTPQWYKWEEKDNKRKLRDIDFLQIFDFKPRGNYTDYNFVKYLPSNDELIQIIKDRLLLMKDNPGRRDDIWWENESNYISSEENLDDDELKNRISIMLRIFLVPMKQNSRYFFDTLLNSTFQESCTHYQFRFDSGEMKDKSNKYMHNMPTYDIFATDLVQFVRDLYDMSDCIAA